MKGELENTWKTGKGEQENSNGDKRIASGYEPFMKKQKGNSGDGHDKREIR